jgi:cell division protein FtsI (penicillin-binding protein 3)
MNSDRRDILLRFGIVYVVILAVAVAIIFKIIDIQFLERPIWMKLASHLTQADREAPATRGNIFAADGELLASTLPKYYLYMDMRAEALRDTLKHHTKALFYEKVDSLAKALSRKLGGRSQEEYRRSLTNAYKRKNGRFLVYPFLVSFSDMQQIRQFPLFNLGRIKSGLCEEVYARRVRPFGDLGSRTIGDIYGIEERGGKNGVELAFDTLLRGKPGVFSRQRIAGRWENVVEVPPENGADVYTTLDVSIQDITESSLLKEMTALNANEGCAIVMEVSTGQIKAVANLSRASDGTYYEKRNQAFADQGEPGSTFKVASVMAALDDGRISENDTIDTGNGIYSFFGQQMKDHNAERGGYHRISVAQAIWYSSNIGVSRAIFKAYKNDPGAFVDKLYRMKLNQPMHFDIPGAGAPHIKHPNDKNSYWSNTSLPWMSIGYELGMPPIYTLAFYNAIANNGKMIRPYLVKEVKRNGKTIKAFTTETINEAICKPTTLVKIRTMLEGVVKYGTGKSVNSPYVKIAGKSGTAQISKGIAGYKTNGITHQVSFCGYFPADNPQYTVICVIREPQIGVASGGHMSGAVVKDIAEMVYVKKMTATPNDLAKTVNGPKTPIVKGGNYSEVQTVLSRLAINYMGDKGSSKWIQTATDGNSVQVRSMSYRRTSVPNVVGLGAKDAVYLLENIGLRAQLVGRGKVTAQSLLPGTYPSKGQTVVLTLAP